MTHSNKVEELRGRYRAAVIKDLSEDEVAEFDLLCESSRLGWEAAREREEAFAEYLKPLVDEVVRDLNDA